MSKLMGKVAIVTGASRGLGAATAARLCEEGATVLLADVLEEQGQATAAALRQQGHRATFHVMDVRLEASWHALVEAANEQHGGLDVLVNNAGIWAPADIESITVAALKHVLDVNLIGPLLGMQAAIPAMRERGGGSIVNVASNATQFIFAQASSYAPSKSALAALTKTAAVHCAEKGYGIRINSIHPGPHETAMMLNGGVSGIAETIPMKRMGRPSEVAAAVAFLVSDDASYITATELFIDGGMTVT
jgi:3alpha(or 20beta)-hydroxysteroid dehydrogenase